MPAVKQWLFLTDKQQYTFTGPDHLAIFILDDINIFCLSWL
jgi:hypothetical protein